MFVYVNVKNREILTLQRLIYVSKYKYLFLKTYLNMLHVLFFLFIFVNGM